MDQLKEGLSLYEIGKILASQTKDILLVKISLYVEDIDTMIKTFQSYHELRKFLFEKIPNASLYEKGNISLNDNIITIDANTDFDSGFGAKPENCKIHIFNLKKILTTRLKLDINNEFSYIKIGEIEEPENIEEINNTLIDSFNNNDEYNFIKMLEAGANNLNDVVELAVNKNNLPVIKILVEYGADNFDYILMEAADNNYFDIINFMLSCEANINEAFLEACNVGLENAILVLSKYENVDINEGLYHASKYDNVDVIKLLLQNNANNTININYVLIEASKYGAINSVNLLLNLGANTENSLFEAAKNGHIKIVKILLDYGIKDSDGYALEEVSKKNKEDIVELLLSQNNYKVQHINNALKTSLFKYNENIAKLLIQNGADNFNEALKLAEKRGYEDIISLIKSKMKI